MTNLIICRISYCSIWDNRLGLLKETGRFILSGTFHAARSTFTITTLLLSFELSDYGKIKTKVCVNIIILLHSSDFVDFKSEVWVSWKPKRKRMNWRRKKEFLSFAKIETIFQKVPLRALALHFYYTII